VDGGIPPPEIEAVLENDLVELPPLDPPDEILHPIRMAALQAQESPGVKDHWGKLAEREGDVWVLGQDSVCRADLPGQRTSSGGIDLQSAHRPQEIRTKIDGEEEPRAP
jgi:hypothetical protein